MNSLNWANVYCRSLCSLGFDFALNHIVMFVTLVENDELLLQITWWIITSDQVIINKCKISFIIISNFEIITSLNSTFIKNKVKGEILGRNVECLTLSYNWRLVKCIRNDLIASFPFGLHIDEIVRRPFYLWL